MKRWALTVVMLLAVCAPVAKATQVYSVVGWGNNSSGQATPPSSGGGFVAIAAGYAHSLALRADGSIAGWGWNLYGQATPPSGTGYKAIAAGGAHSLALRADGSIVGWGNNYDYNGNWIGQAAPPSGTGFTAIAAGEYHSLALRADGSIVGWGNNDYGECNVPSGTGFTAIAAGSFHNLALRADGSIVAWGYNGYGQTTPPSGTGFKAIAAGYQHSLALRADGSIAGWGDNSYGQRTPPSGTGFVAIAAGYYHSLALRADGSIAAWGDNSYGQCNKPSGTGFTAIAAGGAHSLAMQTDSVAPIPNPMTWSVLPHATSVTSIAMVATTASDISGVEYYFTCTAGGGHNSGWQSSTGYIDTGLTPLATYTYTVKARDLSVNQNQTMASAPASAAPSEVYIQTGSIVGWGWNIFGQATPPSGTGYKAIAAGYSHSLALRADGSIAGWGDNTHGQATPPSGTGYTAISAGQYHSLALLMDGSIAGWGYNINGQCNVPSGTGYTAISAGQYHSLALRADGSIAGWGDNSFGQATPPSGTGFVAIAAGGGHSLALRTDGSIVGWGWNNYGQATPPSGTGFKAIAAGWYHSLAMRTDGSIVGWGWNNYGQRTPPAGTGFKAIAAGYSHSLALRANGSITGWGDNGAGQATSPSGTGFMAIAAGDGHSLAILVDVIPPSPNPMTWSILPHVISPTSIAMTATTATDVSGAEYMFTCTAGGGHSSAWQDSATYTDAGLQQGTTYSYTVKARDKSPSNYETGSSAEASVTIPVFPVITAHPMPVAQTICSGDSAQYCVTASDTLPLSYQWQKDTSDIPGATSSCYTASQAGSYRCVVSNPYCSTTSNSATLTVALPPAKAASPVPASGAGTQSINVDISWSNGGRATSYDVYFGTTSSLGPNDRKVSGTTNTSYDPGTLGYNRTYYWRINSTNTCGTTTGDVWSFTTQVPSGPIIAGRITTISGAPLISVTLTTNDGLSCGNGTGQYMFTVPSEWSGTVTPSRNGYYFTPASRSYTSVTTGQLEQNYVAELIPVVLDSVSPSSGPAGTVLTLRGSNLGDAQGRVLIGSTAAVVLEWTSTSIKCIVPAGAVSGNVVVENIYSATSNGVAFTVTVADRLHVSNLADVTLQYGTFQYPFKTIARAITAAVDGTIIEVDDGIYTGPENRGLDTIGKSITVRSANGPASCIIDCNNLDRGFYIHNGEGANTVVDGFTIVNGYDGGLDTTVYGGGISCVGSSPTIHNCVIRNCSGIVGGISIDSGSPVIRNCIIANNSGFAGGILASSSSCTIESCTITGNMGAADMAGGIMYDYCDNISILNTILWNDLPCELLPWESTAAVSYNCISGGYDGERNISTDPLFTDTTDPDPNKRDYHLLAGSPCIDAGDPTSDFSQEPWPNGGRIDIGAYGNTQEATRRDGLALVGYQVVSKRRVGRTSYEYELALTLQNQNSFDVTDVQTRLVATTEAVTEVIDDSVTIAGITAGQTVTSTDTFKIVVDRSRLIEPGRLTWELLYYAVGSQHSGQQVMSLSALGLDPIHPAGDITGDNIVDHTDLMLLADQWLSSSGDPSADIAPDGGDGIVNFQDYAVLAGHWMEGSR